VFSRLSSLVIDGVTEQDGVIVIPTDTPSDGTWASSKPSRSRRMPTAPGRAPEAKGAGAGAAGAAGSA